MKAQTRLERYNQDGLGGLRTVRAQALPSPSSHASAQGEGLRWERVELRCKTHVGILGIVSPGSGCVQRQLTLRLTRLVMG